MENFKSLKTELTEKEKMNLGQSRIEVTNQAQIELIRMVGEDQITMLDWIATNSEKFNRLMNDPKFNFIERLADDMTHAEAIEEIKEKLYH